MNENNNLPQTPPNNSTTKWIIGGVVAVVVIALIVIVQFYAGSVKTTVYGLDPEPRQPIGPSPSGDPWDWYTPPPTHSPSPLSDGPSSWWYVPSSPPSAPPSGMPVSCPASVATTRTAQDAAIAAYNSVVSGLTTGERTACGI